MFFELAFKLVFQVDIGICLLTGGGPATYPWIASWSGNVKVEQRDRCEIDSFYYKIEVPIRAWKK